eukprot:TRINITY_DN43674_c0_g1_i1.p1 TRINITY_DN43674_c0_g1~~TRINITY_DN43674_c0_g1_i1.p1  ORF type:complete len:200 (-),score=51.08 TRINITY_DN43674_c0_g1_i1:157-726(-)
MVQAWYMDDTDLDQRLPHKKEINEPAGMDVLASLGVLYWSFDADTYETNDEFAKLKEERGYSYQDLITCTPEKLPDYETKIKSFFEEHLHTDEEIRFILDGSGYFDVRDKEDRWIRIFVEKNDMIVIPAGIYHRFTLDDNDYIKALRLFVGTPVWTPLNRPQEDHPVRKKYIEELGGGSSGAEESKASE